MLSRGIAEKGIYPAVDPLDSTSHTLTPASSARNTTTWLAPCRRCCGTTRPSRISSPSWAWTNSRRRTSSPSPAPARSALPQPFHVAEIFTGKPGKFSLAVSGFKAVLAGNHDDLPEQAFYMVGGLDEVKEKAAAMAAELAD